MFNIDVKNISRLIIYLSVVSKLFIERKVEAYSSNIYSQCNKTILDIFV